jgi:hypothetical protein
MSASGPLKVAWGVALATAGLEAYVGVAALVSGAPGDRPGGALLSILVTLAIIAIGLGRRRTDLMVRTLAIAGLGQVLAAGVMVVRHWGAAPVILAINGIFVVGWIAAAGLFYAASRVSGTESPSRRNE